MRLERAMLLMGALGCGSVEAPQPGDASTSDATPPCSSTAKFGAPVPVPGLATPALSEIGPSLSADELTVYFWGSPVGDGDTNLYTAHRATRNDAFPTPRLLTALNTTGAQDNDPSISGDDRTLWFASSRIANEGLHLYVVTRPSTLVEFGAAGLAAGLAADDVTKDDVTPFMTADGNEIWFASNRLPTAGGPDIWHATRTGTSFTQPIPATSINSTATELMPTLTADRLTIYFASSRTGASAQGDLDIWTANRPTADADFSPPVLVDELNTPGNDRASWISPDNCRIYGSTSADGGFNAFMAIRQP
jgi:Tol biopolymer transport system component